MEAEQFEDKCKISEEQNERLSIDNGANNVEDNAERRPVANNHWKYRPFKGHLSASGTRHWPKLCRYYKSGYCVFGNKCHYMHERPSGDVTNGFRKNFHSDSIPPSQAAGDRADGKKVGNDTGNNEVKGSVVSKQKGDKARHYERKVFRRPRLVVKSEQLGTPEQQNLKQIDVSYLSKRFQNSVVREDKNHSTEISFTYNITEPDWPFDVHSLKWTCLLPEGYPIQRCDLHLSEEYLPPTLVLHIEKQTDNFLQAVHEKCRSKDVYEPVGREFVRWLDKSVLQLFIDGLKKTKLVVEAESAGISLIMPSNDCNEANEENEKVSTSDVESPQAKSDEEVDSEEDETFHEDDIPCVPVPSNEETSEPDGSTISKGGIEVRISWNNISGNIASISALSLALQIKCIKCSRTGVMTCVEKQLTPSYCKQCKNRQSITFERKIVHEFSNVIGVLDVKGCAPVDCILLSSTIVIVCLKCNTEATVENICYGAPHKTWCRKCHAKCEFSISSARFFGNFRSIELEATGLKKLEADKKKKPVQQVVLVDGQPLPEFGACKHYKKSFRWFRFPCCGKLYPCDQCHDEAETDHEMVLANRIVCGFCSKEQPFLSNKPCVSCKNSVVNTKSAFWEGGKGCRNKTIMSRNDRRKYTNSDQKTVSKKQTLLKENKKKKDDRK